MRESETNLWGTMHPRSCVHFRVSTGLLQACRGVHEVCGNIFQESENIFSFKQVATIVNLKVPVSCVLLYMTTTSHGNG